MKVEGRCHCGAITYEAEVELLTGPISTDEGTVHASGALARTYSELAVSGPLLERAAGRLGLTTQIGRAHV